MNENELTHHGIKGQKWGVRRYQNSDGSLTPAGKKRYGDISYDERNHKIKDERKRTIKNRRILTEAELRSKITKLQLEKQLKDLTEADIAPGRKFVKDVLSGSVRKVAGTMATGTFLYVTKAGLKKEFDLNDFLGYITPKPKNR